jgi:hypothetical protein
MDEREFYAFDHTEWGNGDFEAKCYGCGEALLFHKGDEMPIKRNSDGVLVGVMCSVCHAERMASLK